MSVAVEKLLTSEIKQPARYLGNELGAVHKPWDSATVRWVLTYPEVYEVGASNLGHIILYNILNVVPRQLCDRAYLPSPDLAAKLRSTNTPLFAVESKRSLTDFDILGFSLSYELGATNILEMLDLAGIPLTWQERKKEEGRRKKEEENKIDVGAKHSGDKFPLETNVLYPNASPSADLPTHPSPEPLAPNSWPLIFAGGQTATSNPEPYADFFDFIALGDGEELLPEIGLILELGKANNLSREELLLDLAQIPGVYVPQFYEMAADGSVHPTRPDVPKRILRRVATPIPAYSIGLVPYIETVHDRLTIEIRRGCTRGCRFCQPGMLTRPARDVAPEKVADAIANGMRATGYNEFSLLSLSCSDYLALPALGLEIKNRLKDENITLSLPSQRVDRFDENIANILGGTRQSGLTFAPEAGTQRMRDIINKGLTNEELLRGVKTAFEQGWDKIKLYFMIGLPGETDIDLIGIAETIRWLHQNCRASGRKRLTFNLTISNFTPKPHTPFQWHSVSTAEFERKQALLKAEFRGMKGVKINFTDVRISAMEDFIGRGDRRLASVVRRAWELGAGMDAWWENLDRAFAAWTGAIDESGLSWKYRLVENGEWNVMPPLTPPSGRYSDRPESRVTDFNQALPWDHIDTGIDKNWLKEDLQRAASAATVPDCSFESCSHCGVCGTDFGHNIVVPPPPIPPFAGHFVPNQERKQRLRVKFGKLGDMALVSHLDLVRLFDRALRRASLPISFTGGFHPSPRISPASALTLGATSSGEIVDFELTQVMNVTVFGEKLAANLPANIPIYQVEEVDIKAPSATQLLTEAEYLITVGLNRILPIDGSDAGNFLHSNPEWTEWVEEIKATKEFWWEQTSKSGKVQRVNLRDRLQELELVSTVENSTLGGKPNSEITILRYIGSCRNDGTLLRSEQIVHILEQVSTGYEFQLLQVHRNQLILSPV
ncbi:B12-binding domain-containing radical SAM protein [Oscillatoriales cyanobacterium USR001]|nr:B12-binding domain-containing radical SAM protein [Oscillatoriales cyanobacterium USR001]